jgi:uncharacterized protein YbcC (UPF0753/DUF2309 family)
MNEKLLRPSGRSVFQKKKKLIVCIATRRDKWRRTLEKCSIAQKTGYHGLFNVPNQRLLGKDWNSRGICLKEDDLMYSEPN